MSSNPSSSYPHQQGNPSSTALPNPNPNPNPGGTHAPPPPYSEYNPAGPSGALNAQQSGSSSSNSSTVPHPHPAYPYPHHGTSYYGATPGYQGPSPFPAGAYQQGVPVLVLPPPNSGAQYHFGPTPLTDQQMLLPYAFYTERRIVDGRARWRFCEALLCAVGIYLGIALLVGVEGFGDGWWTFGFGADFGPWFVNFAST
ncbi:hypothetical protein D9611_002679 [Ephemerocybe angulata]|uniref:Uncharacterized protein n=1 Tax=Ephemerocybe angulata TaxID=980116 RepID=A0A8H5C2D6_9AGAR|nr:hypothetical protein D9611_002679 [Tulosesus angulatus]